MKRSIARCTALAATTLLATAAYAQEAPDAEASHADPAPAALDSAIHKSNSVNISPLGVVIGSYALNYEHMFDGGHGVLAEGLLSISGNDDASSLGYGGGVGYRWHWNGTQDSWFAGVNLSYLAGSGDATVETTTNGMTTKEKFDVSLTEFAATANIGRRWAFDFGLNITFRVGAGYASREVSTDSKDPLAQDAVALMDDLVNFIPVAVDGELSVGWVF